MSARTELPRRLLFAITLQVAVLGFALVALPVLGVVLLVVGFVKTMGLGAAEPIDVWSIGMLPALIPMIASLVWLHRQVVKRRARPALVLAIEGLNDTLALSWIILARPNVYLAGIAAVFVALSVVAMSLSILPRGPL